MSYSGVRAALAASVAIYAVAAAGPACAQTKSFNVPAQPAVTGVPELARQADVQILVSESAVRGKRTNAVRGNMTVDQALRRLLEGTGLRATSSDGRTYTLGSATQTGSVETASKSGEGADADDRTQSSAGEAEILVVGSRSFNTDIRRTKDGPQPYVVLQREDIQRSGSSNVEEFLKTRLPMNVNNVNNSQTPGSVNGNASTINLRGLGAAQTLILIDGRRPPAYISTSNGAINQPDINSIPIGSIERIEILPSTASGIYGGGATGGVINIITRRDYHGVEATVKYGSSFRGDAQSYQLSAAGSFSPDNGRTKINFAASRTNSDPLYIGDRDFGRKSRALQMANNPGSILNAAIPILGSTPNIRSSNGQNLVLKNGTTLGSPITFVPFGYAGAVSDGGAALIANAGRYNLDPPGGEYALATNILPQTRQDSVSLGVRNELTSNLEIFGDFFWGDNKSHSRSGSAPTPSSVTLQPSAPNNPFTTPIIVSFAVPTVTTFSDVHSTTLSATGGLIYRPSKRWSFGLDYAWGRSTNSLKRTTPVFNSSFSSAIANGTFDVTRDLAANPLALTSYLLPSPNNTTDGIALVQKEITARASGSVVELPAGWLQVTGILQNRKIDSAQSASFAMSSSGAVTTTVMPELTQRINSAYLEANVPVVSSSMKVPAIAELDLMAAVRYESSRTRLSPAVAVASLAGPLPAFVYNTSEFERPSYTFAVRYKPIDDIQFRASYGTGFAPPTLLQLRSPTRFDGFSDTVIDPKRGGVPTLIGPFSILFGGNPALKPELSRSWSVGAVLTPRFIPSLRFSVDYTNIHKTNEVDPNPVYNNILAQEAAYPNRVVRDPLLPADAALGYTGGKITLIDISPINLASSTVGAFDFQLDYQLRLAGLGRLSLNSVVTYQPDRKVKSAPNVAYIDQSGYSNFGPAWRGNATLQFTSGPLNVAWTAQYIGSYSICNATALQLCPTAISRQGSEFIRRQIYNDLFVSIDLFNSGRPESGVQLTASIQNIFDASPPILANPDPRSSYAFSGDPRLRRFMVGVTKKF